MAATIARFEDDPEGSFAEQTRLRQQLTTVDERLKAFGRRKAASATEPDKAAKVADTELTSASADEFAGGPEPD